MIDVDYIYIRLVLLAGEPVEMRLFYCRAG